MTRPISPPVLSYAQGSPLRVTRTQRILALVAVTMVVANVLIPTFPPWWAERREVCTECGSMRTQAATWFGRRVKVTVTPMALDAWIVAREGSHGHTWQFIGEKDSTGLRGCGRAPASYMVRAVDPFIAGASDADVAALVTGLRHPVEHEQEAAVKHFADVVFPALPRSRSVQRRRRGKHCNKWMWRS